VSAPIPAFAHGRTELLRDTMGEATIAALLRNLGNDPIHAMRGSEGWGGDQAVVLRGPVDGAMSAALLVWKLEWDTPRDGEQFFAAWRRLMVKQYGASEIGGLVFDATPTGFVAANEQASRSPSRWSERKLPADVSACVAEGGHTPGSWLLRRADAVLLLRGEELGSLRPSDLVALIDLLIPTAAASSSAGSASETPKESDR
jgi:hypothetical protein